MTGSIALFTVSAAVIVVAGSFLTKFGDEIAEITGFGRLLVGSILLAGATSLPELLVDLNAVRLGAADMAVGDLMGSSLFNLLILGILDLSHHSRGRMLSRASAAHALSATSSIALTALASMAIVLGDRVPQTFAGLGAGSWALLIAYALGVRMVYIDQRVSAEQAEPSPELHYPNKRVLLIRASLGFIAAALAILITAPLLARAAASIADQTGLGGTFIGTTLVALSTSLPELVASLAALRMGAFDMAVGNIFGSNGFNMVLLVVLDIAQPGALLSDVSPAHALTGLATIVITAVAVLGQLYRIEKRVIFAEPDGILIIGLVAGALALLYFSA